MDIDEQIQAAGAKQLDDSPNPNEDLNELNTEQLISVAKAVRLEADRLRKKLGETQSSCEMLSRTIKEQSDTLINREALLKVAENRAGQLEEAEHERDTAYQTIDDLTEVHERVKADALKLMQKGTDITPVQFAEALDVYSLAVARISSTDAHPQIVVALVQMAMHIRGLETVADIIKWLRGSQ